MVQYEFLWTILFFQWFALIAEKATFDLGTLDSWERSLPFGLLVSRRNENISWRNEIFSRRNENISRTNEIFSRRNENISRTNGIFFSKEREYFSFDISWFSILTDETERPWRIICSYVRLGQSNGYWKKTQIVWSSTSRTWCLLI